MKTFDSTLIDLDPDYVVGYLDCASESERSELVREIVKKAKAANDPSVTPRMFHALINHGFITDPAEQLVLYAQAAELGDFEAEERQNELFSEVLTNAIEFSIIAALFSIPLILFWNRTFGGVALVLALVALIMGVKNREISLATAKALVQARWCLFASCMFLSAGLLAGLWFFAWEKICVWWNSL